MSRVPLISRDELPDYAPMFQMLEQSMGYLPNNILSMAH